MNIVLSNGRLVIGNNSSVELVLKYDQPGSVSCLLLRVSSDYAQPITGQVTVVTCPGIGRAQPELTPSKRQKNYAQPITGQVTEVTCPGIGRAQPELTPSKRQKTGPGPVAFASG